MTAHSALGFETASASCALARGRFRVRTAPSVLSQSGVLLQASAGNGALDPSEL